MVAAVGGLRLTPTLSSYPGYAIPKKRIILDPVDWFAKSPLIHALLPEGRRDA